MKPLRLSILVRCPHAQSIELELSRQRHEAPWPACSISQPIEMRCKNSRRYIASGTLIFAKTGQSKPPNPAQHNFYTLNQLQKFLLIPILNRAGFAIGAVFTYISHLSPTASNCFILFFQTSTPPFHRQFLKSTKPIIFEFLITTSTYPTYLSSSHLVLRQSYQPFPLPQFPTQFLLFKLPFLHSNILHQQS